MSNHPTQPGGSVDRALSDQALIDALSGVARAVAEEAPAVAVASPSTWRRVTKARPPAPRWRRLGVLVGVAGAAAAAAFLVVPRVLRRPSLTFEVAGNAVESGGYVRAVADVPGPATGQVHFSDGTEIKLLDTESRLSVVAPNAHGARLRLDTGRAQFWVQHLPQAAWSVEAGPYVVHVTGTVFDVRWSSRDELCEVTLHSGSVRVTGPGLSDAVPLRAGQRLTGRPARGEVKIERIASPSPEEAEATVSSGAVGVPSSVAPEAELQAPVPVAEQARAPDEPPARRGPVPPPPRASEPSAPVAPRSRALAWVEGPRGATRRTENHHPQRAPEAAPPPAALPSTEPPPLAPRGADPVDTGGVPVAGSAPVPSARPPAWTHRRWSESVAAGDASGVLADAEQIGVNVALEQADSANLGALADAARYQGRPELADRALAQQRARFPGTRGAARAAFLLGRLADDRGDSSEGIRWYNRYLSEAPRGAYADEALGRLMLAIQRRHGRRDAAPLATDYLRRFPNGTYMFQARAILDGR